MNLKNYNSKFNHCKTIQVPYLLYGFTVLKFTVIKFLKLRSLVVKSVNCKLFLQFTAINFGKFSINSGTALVP
jgi:hypothetical protein